MDLKEYNKRLDGVIADLQSGAHAELVVQMANNAIAAIKWRIINTGEDDKGQKMQAYSSKPMLAGRGGMTTTAYGRIAGSKQKRKELKWVTVQGNRGNVRLFELPQGYKQFRELHGRQTQHVDYTFTGRLWSNIRLIRHENVSGGYKAVVSAATPEDKKKLEGLGAKRGKVLSLAPFEVTYIMGIYNKGILQIFRKNGL